MWLSLSLSFLFDKTKIERGKLIKKKKLLPFLPRDSEKKKFVRQIFGEKINSSITEK